MNLCHIDPRRARKVGPRAQLLPALPEYPRDNFEAQSFTNPSVEVDKLAQKMTTPMKGYPPHGGTQVTKKISGGAKRLQYLQDNYYKKLLYSIFQKLEPFDVKAMVNNEKSREQLSLTILSEFFYSLQLAFNLKDRQ